MSQFVRYYPELPSELYKSRLVVVFPSYSQGFGVSLEYETLDLLRQLTAEFSYGFRLSRAKTIEDEEKNIGYFAGICIGAKRTEYDKERFRLGEPDPLFTKYGTSKNTFFLTLGITKRTHKYSLGLILDRARFGSENLNPDTPDQERFKFPLAVEMDYRITNSFSIYGKVGYSDRLREDILVERYFNDGRIGLSVGGNLDGLQCGLSFKPNAEKGLEIRYQLYYPYRLGGMLTHQATLLWRRKPLPPITPDIEALDIKLLSAPIQSNPNSLEISLKNDGQRRTPSFVVAVAENGKTIIEHKVQPIEPKATLTIRLPYKPELQGNVELELIGDAENNVLESDKGNNRLTKIFKFYPHPAIGLETEAETLKLVQKTDIYLNEPLVPIIFFAEKSYSVDTIYFRMMRELTRRLKENPDVILEIRGYYDKEGDKISGDQDGIKLALARANAVKRAFEAMGVESNRLIVVESGYDFSYKRAYKQDFEGTRRGANLVAEENRRAELNATIDFQTAYLLTSSDTISDEFIHTMSKFKDVLIRNPDIIVIVSVVGGKKVDSDFDPYLRRARIAAETVKLVLGENLKRRVYFEHIPTRKDTTYITVSLLPSPIIFDPIRVEKKADAYAISSGKGEIKFIPVVKFPQRVMYYRLQVEDESGNIFWAQGGENIPDTITWDWKNKKGEYPSVWSSYSARLFVRDEFGLEAKSEPVPLFINLENIENLTENLILTQFMFGEAESEIKHQNARIEYIAQNLLNRFKNEKDITIEVSGHTDNIGVKEGNMRLSLERARTATTKLRNYLFELLGLENPDDLENYLRSQGIRIITEGYGDTKPFTFIDYSGEQPTRLLLGDDSHPLGRIINRRVEINFRGTR